MVDETDVRVYNNTRWVIPTLEMQSRIIQWYHHYLQHPGETRLEMTLKTTMYWKGITSQVWKYVKLCESCQKGKCHRVQYGKLPPKIAKTLLVIIRSKEKTVLF